MTQQTIDPGNVLSRAIDFSVKLTKDVGNLLILIVLSIIPIVNFIVIGYFAEIVWQNPEEPPKLETSRLGEYFVEGLKVILISLVYFIVPLLLIGIGIVTSGAFHPMGMTGIGFLGLLAGGIFFLLGFILLLAIAFIAYPLLGIILRTGDASKIFAFGEAWSLIQTIGLGNYLVILIALLIINLIVSALGNIVALILSPFLMAITFKALAIIVDTRYPARP
jgi:hypothetical protein